MTAVLSEPVLDAQVSVRGEPQPGFPVEPNTTAVVGGRTVLWLGPDEWLVLGGREEDYPGRRGGGRRLGEPGRASSSSGAEAADVLATGCSRRASSPDAARRRCWLGRR